MLTTQNKVALLRCGLVELEGFWSDTATEQAIVTAMLANRWRHAYELYNALTDDEKEEFVHACTCTNGAFNIETSEIHNLIAKWSKE